MRSTNLSCQMLREKVVALARRGVKPSLIVQQVPGASIDTVYNILSAARRRGEPIERFSSAPAKRGDGVVFRISISDAEHQRRLIEAAAKRGMTRSQLLNRLVIYALHDGMVDAILDDGVKSHA